MSAAAPIRKEQVAWALEMLEIPAGATTRAVRAAMIAQLEDSEFVPPPVVAEALQVLAPYSAGTAGKGSAQAKPLPPANAVSFHLQRERQLRETVDAFAEQFFSLPVPERQATWSQLIEQAQGFPPIMLRLESLRPGLTVAREAIESTEHRILAEACLQMFVMRPARRAAARNTLLGHRTDKNWVRSVRLFSKTYPQFAALEPELFSRVQSWRQPSHQPTRVTWNERPSIVRGVILVFGLIATLALVVLAGMFRSNSSLNRPPVPPDQPINVQFPPGGDGQHTQRLIRDLEQQGIKVRRLPQPSIPEPLIPEPSIPQTAPVPPSQWPPSQRSLFPSSTGPGATPFRATEPARPTPERPPSWPERPVQQHPPGSVRFGPARPGGALSGAEPPIVPGGSFNRS